MTPTLTTPRLILRPWRDADLAPFAAMNSDPAVMAYYTDPLSREESDALVGRFRTHFAEHGYGMWAIEARGVAEFIGFVGLGIPRYELPFMPCVEIAWRLARPYWGRGYALEAARASLEYGFAVVGLDEIVSFTSPANVRSWRLMERLGMRRDEQGDFDHPAVPDGHPLRRCVLYRLRRTEHDQPKA